MFTLKKVAMKAVARTVQWRLKWSSLSHLATALGAWYWWYWGY